MPQPKTLAHWKKLCIDVARDLVDVSDLFTDDDLYSIETLALDMYATGKTPEEFIRKAFAEDLRLDKEEALTVHSADLSSETFQPPEAS